VYAPTCHGRWCSRFRQPLRQTSTRRGLAAPQGHYSTTLVQHGARRTPPRRGTLVFEKSKGKDGKDVWKNAAGKDVDTAKVEDMLTKLSNVPRPAGSRTRVDPC